MNRHLVFFCVLFLFLQASALPSRGQPARDEVAEILDKISNEMKVGNYKALLPLLFENVYISIDDATARYPKKGAERILRRFFEENPPEDYSYIHHGHSSEWQVYYIARYVSSAGNYRVYWFFKKKQNDYQVYSISFTSEAP